MRKLALLFVVTLVINLCANIAVAKNLNERNDIFTPAFQLLWNDLSTQVVKKKINFAGIDPKVARVLNSNNFTQDDVNSDSYYKIVAPKTSSLKAQIEKAIFDKFGEKTQILNDIDWNNHSRYDYILYAMLIKNVSFPEEFQELDRARFAKSSTDVKYFGVKDNQSKYKKQIKPLFYYGKNDFAVSLSTDSGDKVVLYRTDSKENVYNLYGWDVLRRTKERLTFGEADKLLIPEISLEEKIIYPQLINRKIVGSEYSITTAIDYVKFNLDKKGARLKNEAAIVANMSMIPIPGRAVEYNFNAPFIIYLVEAGKDVPYFALRIDSDKYLVK